MESTGEELRRRWGELHRRSRGGPGIREAEDEGFDATVHNHVPDGEENLLESHSEASLPSRPTCKRSQEGLADGVEEPPVKLQRANFKCEQSHDRQEVEPEIFVMNRIGGQSRSPVKKVHTEPTRHEKINSENCLGREVKHADYDSRNKKPKTADGEKIYPLQRRKQAKQGLRDEIPGCTMVSDDGLLGQSAELIQEIQQTSLDFAGLSGTQKIRKLLPALDKVRGATLFDAARTHLRNIKQREDKGTSTP